MVAAHVHESRYCCRISDASWLDNAWAWRWLDVSDWDPSAGDCHLFFTIMVAGELSLPDILCMLRSVTYVHTRLLLYRDNNHGATITMVLQLLRPTTDISCKNKKCCCLRIPLSAVKNWFSQVDHSPHYLSNVRLIYSGPQYFWTLHSVVKLCHNVIDLCHNINLTVS